jgi:hypothetical protein
VVIFSNNCVPTSYKLGISGLPNFNPGKGTKQLWYDPADGNR